MNELINNTNYYVAEQHLPTVDSVFPEEAEQSFRLQEAH